VSGGGDRRPSGDDRAREGLDHLQAAGLELIAAARAFLDVAEALVREPGSVPAAVQVVEGIARDLRGQGDRRAPGAPEGPGPAPAGEEPAVRPIRLS
jgi:hypothetical protein